MTKKKAPEDLQKRGRKLLYGEETVLVGIKVPKTKEKVFRRLVAAILKKWEVKKKK